MDPATGQAALLDAGSIKDVFFPGMSFKNVTDKARLVRNDGLRFLKDRDEKETG